MNVEQYYLDLNKVNQLTTQEEKDQIHRYYLDMLNLSYDNRAPMAKSIFLTLFKGGYLVDNRDEKIDQVING